MSSGNNEALFPIDSSYIYQLALSCPQYTLCPFPLQYLPDSGGAVEMGTGGWWWVVTSLLSALCGTYGLQLHLQKEILLSAIDFYKMYSILVYLKLCLFQSSAEFYILYRRSALCSTNYISSISSGNQTKETQTREGFLSMAQVFCLLGDCVTCAVHTSLSSPVISLSLSFVLTVFLLCSR